MALDRKRQNSGEWQLGVLKDLSRVRLKSGLSFTLKADRFWFLRHGQTEWNVSGISQGHIDVDINEIGREQAIAAGKMLQQLGIAEIVASDLSRAKNTALLSGLEIGVHNISVDPRLRERSFGTLEGAASPRDAWLSDDAEVERLEVFARRTMAGICAALNRPNVLICAHGGNLMVLEAMLEIVMPSDYRTNAMPICFVRRESRWVCNALAIE